MINLPSPAEYERFYSAMRSTIASGYPPYTITYTNSLLDFFEIVNREFSYNNKTYRVSKATLVEVSDDDDEGRAQIDILPTPSS